MERGGRTAILGILLAVGVWSLVAGRSLWFDELFALHAASLSPWELVRFVRDHDAHPPLYYALLKAWTKLWGTSERSVRALSLVLGLATLLAVDEYVRRRLGTEPAGVAVAALAVSPLFLQASSEATRYALLTFLYVVAGLEVLATVEGKRRRPWRVGLVGSLLLYTHSLGLLLLGCVGVFAAWYGGREGLRRVAVGLALAGLAFVPWAPVFWYHVSAGRFDPPWRPALPATLPLQLLHVVGFGGRVFETAGSFSTSAAPWWVEVALAVPVLVWLGAGLWGVWHRSAGLGRLVLCCTVLPAGLLLGVSYWKQSMVAYPRYFVFAVPYLALAAGSLAGPEGLWGRERSPRGPGGSAAGSSDKTGRSWARAVVGMCAAAVLVLSVGSLARWGENLTEGMGDRRALAAELSKRLRPGDAVAVYPRWEATGVDYYLPQLRGRFVALRSEWTEDAYRALREQVRGLSRADRVWVVQGFPMAPQAFEAIYRQLSRTHRVAYFGEFDGLRLTLFVRRGLSP